MDIFAFLDGSVRGTVNFIYDLLRTTVTLVTKPVAGPLRLWQHYRSGSENRISPLTYLTLILVLVSFAYPAFQPFVGNRPGLDLLANFAALLTTGSITTALIPLLGGAIAGSVVMELILRALGLALRRGNRRERFIGVMEYELGGFLLIIIGSLLLQQLTSENTGTAIVILPFYAAAFVIAVHFYGQLLGKPRWYRFAHSLPRKLEQTFRAGPSSWSSWMLERMRHPLTTLKSLAIAYLKLFLALLMIFPPFFIVGAGLFTRGVATNWLVEQQQPTATITFLQFHCDLATTPMSAGAVAWNSSSKPALGWKANLRVELTDGNVERSLIWTPHWTDGRSGDLLKPGETGSLEGPLSLAGNRIAIDQVGTGAKCQLSNAPNGIAVRSEGNTVQPRRG